MCKDKGAALQWPTLTSERIRTDSVLYRENKRAVATAPGCSGEMGRGSGCALLGRALLLQLLLPALCGRPEHRYHLVPMLLPREHPPAEDTLSVQCVRRAASRKDGNNGNNGNVAVANGSNAQRCCRWHTLSAHNDGNNGHAGYTMMARMARQGHDSQCVRCVERCAEQHIEGQRNDGKSGQAGP